MNLPDLAASLGYALTLGIVAAVLFCAAAGAIVVFAWAIARRSR
jgi:hypothetical protein